MGLFSERRLHRKTVHLSDKDPKEQQGDVPQDEEEGGTDPQGVEQGQIQQSGNAVERLNGAVEMKIQCFTDPGSGNVSQKEIHHNVVPERVKCLSGAALHNQGKGSFKAKVLVLLNSVERHVVNILHYTQQTVRESNKSSCQQKKELVLIETHLRRAVGLCTRVAQCFISRPDDDGATPGYDYSHDAVGQGVEKLTRVEQLTQQCNF